jgi:preprotein translocase subunit SecA
MDDLKEGIGLRGYGQKDPLVEYKREGFEIFVELLDQINRETVKTLYRIPIDEVPVSGRSRQPDRLALVHQDAIGMGFAGVPEPQVPSETFANASEGDAPVRTPVKRQGPKVGRNAPCPCGSGKKYKKCHGRA